MCGRLIVEREWSAILGTVRAGMLALPSRVGARLGHLTPADVAIIDADVRQVLAEVGKQGGSAHEPEGPFARSGN